MGYHRNKITKGELGEVSKIREELEELEDATQQGAKVLALCEAADLVGALRLYLARHHPGIKLQDLEQMADLTAAAFAEGVR